MTTWRTTNSSRFDPGEDVEPLLVVDDLTTHFELPAGMVEAVDGVSFELYPGRTVGIVGESGSGQTVLSRSIMRLTTGSNVHNSGSVTLTSGARHGM